MGARLGAGADSAREAGPDAGEGGCQWPLLAWAVPDERGDDMTHDLTRDSLTILCSRCPVRDLHCGDCMVTAMVDPAAMGLGSDLPLDVDERAAVTACVRAGLVSAEVAATVRSQRVPFDIGRAVG